MVRYPHTLVLSWKRDGTFVDGDYTAGTTITKTIEGRADLNGKGSFVPTEDGAQVVYTYTFYCTPQTFKAPFGASATLTLLDGTWTGKVQGQSNNQINTVIWL